MFKILQKSFRTGLATTPYPKAGAKVSARFRGRPVFDFAQLGDAAAIADACPTGAIAAGKRVAVDYGRCIFCGECAAASPDGSVRMSQEFEMAVTDREALKKFGDTPGYLRQSPQAQQPAGVSPEFFAPTEQLGHKLKSEIHRLLGRALAIREVDSGSCNGCELEINALNNPIYDIERFGIHFVASPRHADMLLVTGPITRNMELALRKTYDATPEPKLVAAVGACGISGGMFGVNYATRGGVDQVIPVDVYIPGCPPRPEALLYGILLAIGRLGKS